MANVVEVFGLVLWVAFSNFCKLHFFSRWGGGSLIYMRVDLQKKENVLALKICMKIIREVLRNFNFNGITVQF